MKTPLIKHDKIQILRKSRRQMINEKLKNRPLQRALRQSRIVWVFVVSLALLLSSGVQLNEVKAQDTLAWQPRSLRDECRWHQSFESDRTACMGRDPLLVS